MFDKRLLYLFALIFIAACDPITVTPTSTVAPSATPVPPTLTPIPTNTPVPVAFPTPAPSPGATTAPTSQRFSAAPPVVQIASPTDNTQLSVNQTFNIVVSAFSTLNISRIDLFDDGVPIKIDGAPTVTAQTWSLIVPWTPNQIGQHVLRAVAYDAGNRAGAPDEVNVTIVSDSRKPTAIIVFPIGIPQIDFGSLLSIYGVATDEAAVAQVELWADNQLYTYLTSPTGQTTLSFQFAWHALAPGAHTFFVRARDNQDQTTDSTPLKVLVVGPQNPSVAISVERTNASVGEPITVTLSALDLNGIQRIELLNGKEIIGTFGNAARTASFSTQVVWTSPNPGDFSLSARAQNVNGNVAESAPQLVSILRAGQATPTLITLAPTRTRTPRATLTPRSQPPPPPRVEISSPEDRFSRSAPLRITFSGQASAELERIELWGALPGQPNPQIICQIDAKGTTQKNATCEWTPPIAGVVTIFAQAIDSYRQIGRSAQISGSVGAAAPVAASPTLTPAPPSWVGRWNAVTSTGPMTLTLRPVGANVRGDLKMAGVDATGRIISSNLRADRLSFSVDFGTETPTPSANALTIEFECVPDLNVGTLSCTYRDSRNRTGAAFFRRETSP